MDPSVLIPLSGILSGILASLSTTIKDTVDKDFKQYENNPNYFLSTIITFGLYCTFGIPIIFFLYFVTTGILFALLPLILSALLYFSFNYLYAKKQLRINLPRIIDVIFFLWSILIFYILSYLFIVEYLLFNVELLNNYKEIYSILLTTFTIIFIMILK